MTGQCAQGSRRRGPHTRDLSGSARPRLADDPLTVRLAAPRGFCAGVERAIRTVEDALAHYGAPVYVRHEIVHNAHVVSRLRAMGALFVDALDDVPDHRPVIFSAHGVAKSVEEDARDRGLAAIDATCPLVVKVHREIQRYAARNYQIALIGHGGHPEVVGSLGQVAPGRVALIETADDASTVQFTQAPLAYVTQTTLSVDETRAIIDILRDRFPHIEGPRTDDICYATTNRQAAVKAMAPDCDMVLVVGDKTSSNSCRLIDTAVNAGARTALLVPDPATVDLAFLNDVATVGITSGASAPESLVEDLLARLAAHRTLKIEHVETARETLTFKQPVMPGVAGHNRVAQNERQGDRVKAGPA